MNASAIPLFTSIPSKCHRVDKNGTPIGDKYQIDCIRSWKAAGFSVYSINSSDELLSEAVSSEIKILRVKRDAFLDVGKRVIYLEDMLNKIRDIVISGPFVLTNADVFLKFSQENFERIASLKAGDCIVEKRCDVNTVDTLADGEVYQFGFDFFCLVAEDIHLFLDQELVFGMPWWDFFMPVKAQRAGLRRVRLTYPVCYHLKHSDRWDNELWLFYAKRFEVPIYLLNSRFAALRWAVSASAFYQSSSAPDTLISLIIRYLKRLYRILKLTLFGEIPELKYVHMGKINLAVIDAWK